MITQAALSLSTEALELLAEIENFLKIQESAWTDEALAKISEAGMTTGTVAPEIFERTFTLPMNFDYAKSNADRYQSQFEHHPSGPTAALTELGLKVERFAQATLASYSLPGYLFTSRFQSQRTRIPVHVHKNMRPDADGTEINLSIALRFKKTSHTPCTIRFYPRADSHSNTYMHESLIDTPPALEIAIDTMINVFVFDGREIPHTVIFSDDIVLWAVIGSARMRFPQPKADILIKQGPFS